MMMNLDVVNINEYSLLYPNFKIFIFKFYDFKSLSTGLVKMVQNCFDFCPQGRLKKGRLNKGRLNKGQ